MPDQVKAPTPIDPAPEILSGGGVRGEVAGCPTGLAGEADVSSPDNEAVLGGAPGTIASPGEGVNEEEQKRSGLEDG